MNCLFCEEPIADDDPVISTADGQRFHRECMLRQVIGSVAHQQRRCSCFGGNGEDDPALTRRQAAKAAVEAYERRKERNPC